MSDWDAAKYHRISDPQLAWGRAVAARLNAVAGRGTPPIAELQTLGVRRLSVGSGPCRATMALTREIATELRSQGTYESFTTRAIPYPEVNQIMRVTVGK